MATGKRRQQKQQDEPSGRRTIFILHAYVNGRLD